MSNNTSNTSLVVAAAILGVAIVGSALLVSRSVAERMYSDIRRWTVLPKGGHFAALEQPEALAKEIRAFFRPLRAA